MAETYCGKSCVECSQKEQQLCAGCKVGPGRQYGGDCEIAKCAREKGHETCETCSYHGNCGTFRGRDHMPEYRRKKQAAETIRKEAAAKRAPVLCKWLWVIFWLIIPSSVGSLLANDTVVQFAPALYLPGTLLNTICCFVYGAILLRLGTEEDRYRTAGICVLIAGGIGAVVNILSGGGQAPNWTLLLSLPAVVVELVGEYNEYQGHAIVLTGVDNTLSDKWTSLWKWFIGLYLGLFGCIVLIAIMPALGLLVMLAAAIGILVVSIVKLVYLYRTAKIFREYTAG